MCGLIESPPEMSHLFVENKIITDKKRDDIQQCITAATGDIAEGLDVHIPAEGPVEKVNSIDHQLGRVLLSSEGAKVKN